MTAAVHKSFEALQVPVRARLQRHMEQYSRDGPAQLISGKKFVPNEGRHSLKDGTGRTELIGAFKHVQAGVRIYGSLQSYKGHATFICTEIDTNKKKRKADPEKLQRAAENLGMVLKDE